MKNETIAGFIGIVFISLFLIGLSASISQPPFWVISIFVLICAWTAWIQDTILNPNAE